VAVAISTIMMAPVMTAIVTAVMTTVVSVVMTAVVSAVVATVVSAVMTTVVSAVTTIVVAAVLVALMVIVVVALITIVTTPAPVAAAPPVVVLIVVAIHKKASIRGSRTRKASAHETGCAHRPRQSGSHWTHGQKDDRKLDTDNVLHSAAMADQRGILGGIEQGILCALG